MRIWHCVCGNQLHFENQQCFRCGRQLGYWPAQRLMVPLDAAGEAWVSASDPARHFRRCRNDLQFGICNWLIPDEERERVYCTACWRNEVIPDLSQPRNPVYWARLEAAKRLLIDDLLGLNLPMDAEDNNPALRFAFLADDAEAEAGENRSQVITGHSAGLITINVAEADPVNRETLRLRLGEPYRTLLGHMRHESGHYYWARLARDVAWLTAFRECFGDERADYAAALEVHYRADPPMSADMNFVSGYAKAHPWEDFAECWGHYLHIRSALETANAYDLRAAPPATDFDSLIQAWLEFVPQLNAMARSLGKRDLYPFVLGVGTMNKIRFVHDSVASLSA